MITVPNEPATRFTAYADLKGVDWSVPVTEVRRDHASDILNMIPRDGESALVKRKGWRVDHTFTGAVIAAYHDAYSNTDYLCTETKAYKKHGNTYTELGTYSFKHIIPFNGDVYFLGTSGIYRLNGNTLISVDYTVPHTKYGLAPDGSGGTAYEGVNAFTTRRQITFVGDSTSVDFVPHITGDFATVIEKVEVMNDSTGSWEEQTSGYTLANGTTYSALDESGTARSVTTHTKVTFSSAKPSSRNQDNVRLTIRELDTTIYEGTTIYGDYCRLGKSILASDIVIQYGSVNIDRVFAVVEGNKIYYSDVSDIGSFPDDNYLVAGSSSPIVGLHRKSNYLVAVTGDSSDHAVFMIKSSTAVITENVTDESGDSKATSKEQQFFSVRPATSGRGAVASKSFDTLVDEPLFLGSTGIYAITTNSLTTETVVTNRSTFINSRLCSEPNLQNAVGVVWKEYYIICINSHCYILDSKTVTRDRARNNVYECFYWDNVPATIFLAYGEELWFGTSDGKWCRFNTDVDDDVAYCDNGTWTDNGETLEYTENTGTPVKAYWTTLHDDCGMPQFYKTLTKKGAVCNLVPATESSVDIYYMKDGGIKTLFAKTPSQATSDADIDVFTLKKVKKFKRLGFVFENDKMQPFGLIKFVAGWTQGNYAK